VFCACLFLSRLSWYFFKIVGQDFWDNELTLDISPFVFPRYPSNFILNFPDDQGERVCWMRTLHPAQGVDNLAHSVPSWCLLYCFACAIPPPLTLFDHATHYVINVPVSHFRDVRLLYPPEFRGVIRHKPFLLISLGV